MSSTSDSELIYVGDPMCSWCWGFAPVLDSLRDQFATRAAFRVVLGGLRPGSMAETMTASVKAMIRSHWESVKETTGQPFDFSFFARDNFRYDTEPAARAVVAVRTIAPELEFDFFKALQEAFYAKNIDITLQENYNPLLSALGIDRPTFHSQFQAAEMRRMTYRDFARGHQMGIRGFPSLLLRKGQQLALLTSGYQPLDSLSRVAERFLSDNG